MFNSGYTDVARLVLAILAAVGFVIFAVRINDDAFRMSRGWIVTRLSLLGIVGSIGYGAIELMVREPPVPLGLRVYMVGAFLIGLLVGLYMVRHEDGPNEGWIKASDIERILTKVEDAHNDPCHNPGCLVARDEMRAEIKTSRERLRFPWSRR